ncbi:SCP2 sterol-binding domain-containing protein [Pelomicrobium methylotrophicum]|jgi:putative sterol carrier protein|uniref:Sterol-binding protein n=1 Tax=Pelomicrobium methylotrophicum TaxID=2602750 RepID=A0A5C7EUZ3_9PROT|nr:SCP2 sterol-binding domain-containing protein [Pelomicrobium methylotrophicum]TXF12100.1 sterol-binding protein [Pelomicrobium methylotrophicum]
MARKVGLSVALVLAAAPAAWPAPVLMSTEWARALCAAWNADPVLTRQLVESGWVKNHAGRGYKVMQLYRQDCPDSPRIELRVSEQDGSARCVYGGAAESKLDSSADYLMWAETKRWQEMGRGEYGPMRAMFFNRLQFEGPRFEAMGNMGPFESFLLLVGKVPGDAASCPAR